MRNKLSPNLRLLAVGCLLILSSSCLKDKVTKSYTVVTAIYSTAATVIGNINGNPQQPISSIGRLYLKDNLIYLNEPDKGIHVIDNTDPTHPQQIAWLNIPGNEEIAIKGNTLYADMYNNLLSIDISNPRQIKVTGMTANVFMDRYYGINTVATITPGGVITNDSLVLTGYITRDTTISTDPPKAIHGVNSTTFYYDNALTAPSASAGSSNSGAAIGVAGSMAKMVLLNNYLYTIPEPHSLAILDITNTPSPVTMPSYPAAYDLETIYPFKDKLFLGSKEGVYIYDVSDPLKPAQVGSFTHGRACDPVIADDNYAYVTLHSGTSCGGAANELDVLNVQNLTQPVQVATYPMTSPQGLSKDNNLLFVCDGDAGVKLYDASNPASLQLLTQISTNNIQATDVIASDKRLVVIAGGSLFQYDYSNPQDVHLLSALTVK